MKIARLAQCALVNLFAAYSFATEVYVNDPIITGITPVGGTTVFGATYRVENGNGNGDQLVGQSEAGSPLAGPSLGRNLGNRTQLTGITWNFELENIVGQGLVFTLSRLVSSSLVENIIGWGTFTPALPGGSTLGSGLPNPGGTTTPDDPYNAISIFVDTGLNGVNTNSVTVGSLVFSSPTLTLSPGSVWTAGMSGSNGTDASRRIVFDGDFSQHNWTLTGTVQITKSNNGCPECAIFGVIGSTVTAEFPPDPASVPEPTTIGSVAGGLALLALGSWRRRIRSK